MKKYRFFSISLTIFILIPFLVNSQNSDLVKYVSDLGKFTITFPGPMTERTKQGQNSLIHTVSYIKGTTVYMVKYGINEEPLQSGMEPLYIEKTKDIYVGSGKIESENDIKVGRIEAKQVKFTTEKSGQKIYSFIRILVKGKIWYTLMVYSNSGFTPASNLRTFFDSFQFN